MAADKIGAKRILVVTTASGRGVWKQAFRDWSPTRQRIVVGAPDVTFHEPVVGISSWDSLVRWRFAPGRWDVIILDEDQKAVNPAAARAIAVYGQPYEFGARLIVKDAIVEPADRVWHLSGNPAPHDLGNLWFRMRASCPERLLWSAAKGWPEVLRFDKFRERYCVVKPKQLPNFQTIEVVFGGRNEAELRDRLEGMFLRRTQADVGIRPPSYEFLPLTLSARVRAKADADVDRAAVLAAVDNGETDILEMHLGSLRRVTGLIKAEAVVEAVKDFFDEGNEKIVLAYWHREVGDLLDEGLRRFGVIRLDGATSPRAREKCASDFRQKSKRVFLAQIAAAGEAIDLSPANELWFVETTFSPKDLEQMSLRITN